MWVRQSKLLRGRHLCTKQSASSNRGSDGAESEVQAYTKAYNEALKQLENPDFMTAVKVLSTCPPKRKKFGLDFHLVQFFFTCLPSLAIYLVAQYAHSEMKRMDAELEVKRKREEEAENEKEWKEVENNPMLVEVRVRLAKLEETIKEIDVETKKQASVSTRKDQDDGGTKQQSAIAEPSKAQVMDQKQETLEKKDHPHPSRPKSPESRPENSGLAQVAEDAPHEQEVHNSKLGILGRFSKPKKACITREIEVPCIKNNCRGHLIFVIK